MLIRKLLRTAWKYKTQFISMIIMIIIGVGVFVGFNTEWYSLRKNTYDFFGKTAYADFRIYNENGFSEKQIKMINDIEGLSADRILSLNVDVSDSKDSLSLFVPENYYVSKMMITEGEEFDKNKKGFWLSDKYAKANNISVGDKLSISYGGKKYEAEVLGLGKSSEYTICVESANQLMPDYEKFGFVYASPELIFRGTGIEYYPQINIVSDISKQEIEDKLEDVLGMTVLVTDKSEHISYMGPQSEIEEGITMGSILPVLFLAIAILTMITTMHRVCVNEKIQIGTLKALGFRDKKIIRHYTSYGLFIGIAGSIPGVILGLLIAGIILDENGMMGTYLDLPEWELMIPAFCFTTVFMVVLFMTVISFVSVNKMLRGTASEVLRVYSPKKMKPMFLEKTIIWGKLSFASKWNFRDLFRHKTRTFMSLIGVVGCMFLLVGGIGTKETMDKFLDTFDKKVNNYNTCLNIDETADNEDVIKFTEKYEGDWLSSSGIKLRDNSVMLDIYDIQHDLIRFVDENDNRINLTDDGAYICLRIAEQYEIGDTIEFSLYGSDKTYSVNVAGIYRSTMSESIVMTKKYAESVGVPYKISSVYTDYLPEDIQTEKFVTSKQTKKDLMETYSEFMEIMDMMIIILVVAAIVLGTVVLYNLGVMSYIERSRELATLKVVGFRDKHTGCILISQNIWLTLAGVVIGFPGGIAVLHILINALLSDYELKMHIGFLTLSVSIMVTFGVSLIVGLMVARKNRNIDMVEALKNTER